MKNDKILVIDNYDSFTYNLVHILRELGRSVEIKRNDKLSIEEVDGYEKIMLSPGPGIPNEAGLLLEIIKTYASKKSILGVCLGHQAIAEVFGGTLFNLPQVYHGVSTPIVVLDKEEKLFQNMPTEFESGRYHSWVVNDPLPEALLVTARDNEGRIMALRHKDYDIRGVQFHPESILTNDGKTLIKNWLDI